jgi:lipopolysaccharide/colanic/teichoic acid biosynthesis glycosyltransferase
MDKGISELAGAFRKFRQDEQLQNKVFLLIVGPLEQDLDPLDGEVLQFLTNDDHVTLAGYQSDVRPWLMASDIFVFPSYREGFPNVVMQASCLDLPCIVSDINGCNEIITPENGVIVPSKDSNALYHAMRELVDDDAKRNRLAKRARVAVTIHFDQNHIWKELQDAYHLNLLLASTKGGIFRHFFKPFFDKIAALTGILLLSPIVLICVVLLFWANKGKVWFIQGRPGLHGKIFQLIKFRTMTEERDADGKLLPDEMRLHGIGRLIRRTSLDELPQLVNVIKGEMSLVGPRPLLEEYLPLYNSNQAQRHLVKPGITGWAQVNGRNAISWEQKFEYDIWYVNNQSFLLDLKILVMTLKKVFKAEGINSSTSVTMEKFSGKYHDVGPNA